MNQTDFAFFLTTQRVTKSPHLSDQPQTALPTDMLTLAPGVHLKCAIRVTSGEDLHEKRHHRSPRSGLVTNKMVQRLTNPIATYVFQQP